MMSEDWQEYLNSLDEDLQKLSATLGGVEISKASTKGVFDFTTDEIYERYKDFLEFSRFPKVSPIMQIDDDSSPISDKSSPTGIIGDSRSDPKEQLPETDENGEGLGKNQKTLDQWLNQIINHPEAPGLDDTEAFEDKSYNTHNFWKESPHVDKEVLDLIILEMGL